MLSSHCRVLYVDANKDSLELLRAMLNFANITCEVITTESPHLAFDMLANQSFDLCILDFCLPGMSGIELCRRGRQTDSQTPIMFYSAMARSVDRAEAMKAGATEYLVKPNDIDRLTETVKQLLN